MEWLSIVGWGPILDIIAFCLCGITVLSLFRLKNRLHRPPQTPHRGMNGPAFEDNRSTPFPSPGGAEAESPYETARMLAIAGVGPEDIAGQVDLPRKEIDLMIKLWHKKGGDSIRSGEKREAGSTKKVSSAGIHIASNRVSGT